MKALLMILGAMTICSTSFADTYQCKQMYGDGYNVQLKLSAGEPISSDSASDADKLPFLGKHDFLTYRKFSIVGFDSNPANVISAYSVGAFDSKTNGEIALINRSGQSIGTFKLFEGELGFGAGLSVYGEPGPVTYMSCVRNVQ
ncbi:MAG: hypothetical protein EOP06_15810 [Proteobacteria bacterium]|nr:MAG: hypothetical protein EOP06_15810 [Pseudomonadota bacterium]